MYFVAGVICLIYIFIGFLAREENVDITEEKKSFLLYPFYRIASYLYKKVRIYRIRHPSKGQVGKDLEKLHPGEKKDELIAKYHINKLAKSLMIVLAGTFLALLVNIQSERQKLLGDSGSIVRGTYEEGAKEIEVECSLPEGVQEFVVEVGARVLDEEEITRLYEAFCTDLPGLICGENPSLQEVKSDLYLQEAYERYPFTVSWESDEPNAISSDGALGNVKEAQEIKLHATVCYEEWKWEKVLNVRVNPIVYPREEQIHSELEELLLASELESRAEEKWQLPNTWAGHTLSWKQKTKNMGIVLWMGAIMVAALIYLLTDKDLHDMVEKRKLQMKRAYPDVVHKLVLYLGAGMTIRNSFQRIVAEYEKGKAEGREESAIYEELLHACRELKAGVSEGEVYEHLGKRTGLQEYIRLSTLLTQNLKKGNHTLLQRLREEAEKASLERIQYGKRLVEEAMTKLLLPMVMMLLVVMLIIMIPAFSSVGA